MLVDFKLAGWLKWELTTFTKDLNRIKYHLQLLCYFLLSSHKLIVEGTLSSHDCVHVLDLLYNSCWLTPNILFYCPSANQDIAHASSPPKLY